MGRVVCTTPVPKEALARAGLQERYCAFARFGYVFAITWVQMQVQLCSFHLRLLFDTGLFLRGEVFYLSFRRNG